MENKFSRELPAEVLKYLKKYSYEKWRLERSDIPSVNMAVVIPAIMEFENIKKLLGSLAANDPAYFDRTLVIFVVNNLASSSKEIKKDNQCTIKLLRDIICVKGNDSCLYNTENLSGIQKEVLSSGLRIGLVDASSAGLELPEKDGGVGLARKIGMDLALGAFDYSSDKKKILVCLDADCTVDQNYITEIYRNFQTRDIKAAAVNFSHRTEDITGEHAEAIICYEIFLRYYVLGLCYASSPYGFHTIGSTMACTYESYIKIEGMNKRKAAEDFYFMEKLAKIVPVSKIRSASVYPSPRGSWRVPFGTGQRVNRHLSNIQNEYLLYSPKSFEVLRKWLAVYNSPKARDASFYLNEAWKIHSCLFDFLVGQNFEADYSRIVLNSRKPEQLLKQKSGWFDGFRTLKLIHHLRDNGFPLVPMFDALDEMFSLSGIQFSSGRKEPVPPVELQMRYLEKLISIEW